MGYSVLLREVDNEDRYLMPLDIKLKEEPKAFTPPPAPPNDPDPIPPEVGRQLVDRARHEDIARRVIMGQKSADIAADVGYTERHLRRILRLPAFVEVYERVAKTLYSNLDEVVLDEKLQPLHRVSAMANRSLTLLSEVQAEVRDRIEKGTARSTDLKVGADTAFGIIDRSKGELSPYGSPAVAVQFNINQDKKALLRSVVEEAGVDLSDLGIIDVEPIEDDVAEVDIPPLVPDRKIKATVREGTLPPVDWEATPDG